MIIKSAHAIGDTLGTKQVGLLLLGISLTCALEPPIPKEFTLTLATLPSGKGVGLIGTVSFFSLNGTSEGNPVSVAS